MASSVVGYKLNYIIYYCIACVPRGEPILGGQQCSLLCQYKIVFFIADMFSLSFLACIMPFTHSGPQYFFHFLLTWSFSFIVWSDTFPSFCAEKHFLLSLFFKFPYIEIVCSLFHENLPRIIYSKLLKHKSWKYLRVKMNMAYRRCFIGGEGLLYAN